MFAYVERKDGDSKKSSAHEGDKIGLHLYQNTGHLPCQESKDRVNGFHDGLAHHHVQPRCSPFGETGQSAALGRGNQAMEFPSAMCLGWGRGAMKTTARM